jgi:magnesium transporter
MSAAEPMPAVRAFARRASGVHSVSREEAASLIRTSLSAEGGAGGDTPMLWLDITHPGPEEGAYLRDTIGFHPLAVEDCLRGRQRPKLDRYLGYYFLVFYAAEVNPERGRMALNELHLFLGARFLVTVHDYRVREVGEILARWRASAAQVEDVGTLAHQLMDVVVDDYFHVVEHFADRVEAAENSVFERSDGDPLPQILAIRREMVLFRRVVAPLRDTLGTILRRDLPFTRPALLPYFQDVHDHTIRIIEEIDGLRELLSALLDTRLSSSAESLGNVMRIMTAWSIILMSMTLIAGVYGMNFVFMPELELPWGYFAALGGMAAIGAALVVFFRRRDWL